MISFEEQLLNGIGAAGWVIGFIAAMGAFLIVTGTIVLAVIWIANAIDGPTTNDNNEEVENK